MNMLVVQSEMERQAGIARSARERLMGTLPMRPRTVMPPEPPAPPPVVIPKPAPVQPEFEPLMMPGDFTKSIIQEVCKKHKVSMGEILSHRRNSRIVHARQEAFWRLSKETTLSLPQMARRMGGFDHTTCLHSIRRHEERMAEEAAASSGENPIANAGN